MYTERPSRVPGAVLWQRTVQVAEPQRVLPDGCLDLIWSGGMLLVAGPDTTAHLSSAPLGTRFTGLRFAPGTGPAVVGVPADELRDQRVPLAQLWPSARVRRLAEQLAGASDPGAALESVVASPPPPDRATAAIVAALRAGATVAATADAVGMSERQLHRRCLAAFGYGAKTLVRILRMNRALELAHAGTPFAAVAARAGYADQAHLARDVRALAGVPLGQLIGQSGANSSTLLPSGSWITA